MSVLRLVIPGVLKTRRWLAFPGLPVARTPGGEYTILAAFREDRPGGRLLELVGVGTGLLRGAADKYLCAAGWAGVARLEGLHILVEEIRRVIPVDRVLASPEGRIFLVASPEALRPVLHPAECSEALLPYIRGWLNYLERHSDLGVQGVRRRLTGIGASMHYVFLEAA